MVFKKTDEDDDGLYDEEEPALTADEVWLHPPPTYGKYFAWTRVIHP